MSNLQGEFTPPDDDDGLLWDRIRIGPMTLKQLIILVVLIGGALAMLGKCIAFSRSETERASEEFRTRSPTKK